MKKLTKKQKRRFIIIIIILLVLTPFKIKFPDFIGPYRDNHFLPHEVKELSNNFWKYTPIIDTCVIQDSVRDLRFKVQKAYAYDARMIEYPYIHYLLPWIHVKNLKKVKFFDIVFDYLDLDNIESKIGGVWFSVNKSSESYMRRSTWSIEDNDKSFSIYGTRELLPLPDTLYFTVWGYPNSYLDLHTYRSLTEEQKSEFIKRIGEEKQRPLGEITFVKSDSIIKKSQKRTEKVLLWDLW